MTLASAHVMSS